MATPSMTARMRWRRLLEPRLDAPFPLWMIFPVVFVVLYLSHFSLLRLPYYWDEAGYYIPAAWDFFRTGSLIPTSTLSNAHPPLPSMYLALWWKASGYVPEVTREAILIIASFGLLAVWKLALRLHASTAVAFWTLVLTGLYPIWFAQSTLAHADIFAAAFSLWGLVYSLPERNRNQPVAALWFTAAVLSKETAIVIPLTLAALYGFRALRSSAEARRGLLREAAWLCSTVLPLAAWFGWHYLKTGFLFGNPEFLRYNAQANLDPVRFLAAFGHRLLHLFGHMNMFVPMLLMLAALMLPIRADGAGHLRPQIDKTVQHAMLALPAANAVFFSVLGGALLCRYLLPMYPLILLMAVTSFYRRVPYWHILGVLSAAAFVAALFINPPYGFAPEDNLAYARIIRMHQAGIAQLKAQFPAATVLTAWPMSDELSKPELGYVKEPFDVVAIEDFSSGQIARAEAEAERYSAALVFSTKYDPPPLIRLGTRSEQLDERYFGLHHDLKPEAIAHQLGGVLTWKRENDGLWIGLIRFNRQIEAQLVEPR